MHLSILKYCSYIKQILTFSIIRRSWHITVLHQPSAVYSVQNRAFHNETVRVTNKSNFKIDQTTRPNLGRKFFFHHLVLIFQN